MDHLGHTMDVHRVHYRQTSDIIERVDIAKLLMIQDMGLVGRFKGKNLEEIQFDGSYLEIFVKSLLLTMLALFDPHQL